MRTSFPLLARLLVWLFANFLILLLGLVLMVRIEFGSLKNLLLPDSVQEQIQSLSVTLVGELAHTPREQWSGVLDQLSRDTHMKFALYDSQVHLLAGADLAPPKQVRSALSFAVHPTPPAGQNGPGMAPPFLNPAIEAYSRPPDRIEQVSPRGAAPMNIPPFPKNVIRTVTPSGYWLLVRLPPEPFRENGPVTLIGMTSSLGVSPLLFNPKPWIAVGVGIIVFSVLFWLPFAHNLTTAIANLTRATESIAQGRFEVHLSEARRDELGRLARAINRMTSQLKNFVTGQKRFLGDAAHELCSPLVRMEMGLALLEERVDSNAISLVRDVKEELSSMRELVNELLNFSKASMGESQDPLGTVDLREAVELAIVREAIPSVKMIVEIPPRLVVLGTTKLLVRAISNLIRNSVRYAGDSGPISIRARVEDSTVWLTVTDCGPGVPAADLAKLFDPFYRVDTARTSETGGVGLGLAIVKSCVEACQGTVNAANGDPCGLEIKLCLKRAS